MKCTTKHQCLQETKIKAFYRRCKQMGSLCCFLVICRVFCTINCVRLEFRMATKDLKMGNMIWDLLIELIPLIPAGIKSLRWFVLFPSSTQIKCVFVLFCLQLHSGPTDAAELHYGIKSPRETKHKLGSRPGTGPAESQSQHPNQHGLILHGAPNVGDLCTYERTCLI